MLPSVISASAGTGVDPGSVASPAPTSRPDQLSLLRRKSEPDPSPLLTSALSRRRCILQLTTVALEGLGSEKVDLVLTLALTAIAQLFPSRHSPQDSILFLQPFTSAPLLHLSGAQFVKGLTDTLGESAESCLPFLMDQLGLHRFVARLLQQRVVVCVQGNNVRLILVGVLTEAGGRFAEGRLVGADEGLRSRQVRRQIIDMSLGRGELVSKKRNLVGCVGRQMSRGLWLCLVAVCWWWTKLV